MTSTLFPAASTRSFPDMVQPFWEAQTMLDESVLPFRASAELTAELPLRFTPTTMPQVRSATGDRLFEPGVDYDWQPATRRLSIPPGSRIEVFPEAVLYPPRGSQKHGTCRDRECDLLFGEGGMFHRMQLAVTYPHRLDHWTTPPTLLEPQPLPRLGQRLASNQTARIVLLGDSISTGANASGLYGQAPGNPGYGPLVAEAIAATRRAPVDFTNLSVGGMDSAWGVQQIDSAIACKPDLLIIAFGMNDASAGVTPSRFAANLRTQAEQLHAAVPDAQVILVSPMTGHRQWTGTDMAAYPRYRDAMLDLRRPGTAVADVTSVWLALLAGGKRDVDLTGNGLNHPNDFGHQVYAQTLWSVLRHALK